MPQSFISFRCFEECQLPLTCLLGMHFCASTKKGTTMCFEMQGSKLAQMNSRGGIGVQLPRLRKTPPAGSWASLSRRSAIHPSQRVYLSKDVINEGCCCDKLHQAGCGNSDAITTSSHWSFFLFFSFSLCLLFALLFVRSIFAWISEFKTFYALYSHVLVTQIWMNIIVINFMCQIRNINRFLVAKKWTNKIKSFETEKMVQKFQKIRNFKVFFVLTEVKNNLHLIKKRMCKWKL